MKKYNILNFGVALLPLRGNDRNHNIFFGTVLVVKFVKKCACFGLTIVLNMPVCFALLKSELLKIWDARDEDVSGLSEVTQRANELFMNSYTMYCFEAISSSRRHSKSNCISRLMRVLSILVIIGLSFHD